MSVIETKKNIETHKNVCPRMRWKTFRSFVEYGVNGNSRNNSKTEVHFFPC